MANVVLVIHLLLALLLIGAVLLQRSEGGALGIGGGGGGNVMSGRSSATALQKATWGLCAAFIATSLVLTLFAIEEAQDRGLGVGAQQPDPTEERAPSLAVPPPVGGASENDGASGASAAEEALRQAGEAAGEAEASGSDGAATPAPAADVAPTGAPLPQLPDLTPTAPGQGR